MAGHNKWSKVKHKKAREGAKKGKLFTRLARDIQVAARVGGPDPKANAALRAAVDRAIAKSMPGENIQRAINRGSGQADGDDIQEIYYEGYAPGGVAVIVACLTDNRNRTAGEVRYAFSKNGGTMGDSGAVAWNFSRVGRLLVEAEADEDTMTELAITVGADDVRPGDEDGIWVLLCAADALGEVRDAVVAAGYVVDQADLAYEPKSTVVAAGDAAERVLKFIGVLDGLDDVQEIFANVEIPNADLERLADAV